nr:hypothetical protein [Candidatus Njordarchaeum guaymaensis]
MPRGQGERSPDQGEEASLDHDEEEEEDLEKWRHSHGEADPVEEWSLNDLEETLIEKENKEHQEANQTDLGPAEHSAGLQEEDSDEASRDSDNGLRVIEENGESWERDEENRLRGEGIGDESEQASREEEQGETPLSQQGREVDLEWESTSASRDEENEVGSQATLPENEESNRSVEWSLEEYENTMVDTASSNEITPEAAEIEEQNADRIEAGLSGDSGNQEAAAVREEEHGPIRLSEDPSTFVSESREAFVELGIIPEHDEVKLDEDTTLKFDVTEGLTVVHEDQTYHVSSVEQGEIGDMEFFKYKTEMGEEFLHITDQDKVVPPNETPWYALPSNTEVYLDREYKHELLDAALDKAGGETALRHELEERGTQISDTFVYKHLHDLRDGMSEDKLIPILDYLGKDLDEINSHITAIGHSRAIENPNLPFNLNNEDGARIMAARFSDGTNCAPEGRGPRFDYANNDAEQRNRVIESLENVFGGANILNREYDNGEVAKVRTSTDVIGHVLERAGAVTGEIVDKNPHIPTWIREGSTENKREWLAQSFGDEGYVWPQRGKVCTGRSVEASSILSEDMSNRLDQMNWEDKFIHGRFVDSVRPCDDLPTDIYQAVRGHPPNLLVEERTMLNDFGIETAMYPSEMHQGKYGDYSAQWVLQTETREDTRRFLDEVGFPQERKQEGLISTLRLDR